MPGKEILYISYNDEPLEDGVSYALYLAGLLGEKLRVVLLSRKSVSRKFDDLMEAVTYAEANEHDKARDVLTRAEEGAEKAAAQNYIVDRCRGEGVDCTVHSGIEATGSVFRDIVSQKKVDMVLLSPLVTLSRNVLNKLVKFSPRPVVTMARGEAGTAEAIEGGSTT